MSIRVSWQKQLSGRQGNDCGGAFRHTKVCKYIFEVLGLVDEKGSLCDVVSYPDAEDPGDSPKVGGFEP